MLLDAGERLTTLTLLPKEGNFTNLKLIREAREALSFDEVENRTLNPRVIGDDGEKRVVWNFEADTPREIEIGTTVSNLIAKELKKLNDTNKLTSDHISIYEKFVENKKE